MAEPFMFCMMLGAQWSGQVRTKIQSELYLPSYLPKKLCSAEDGFFTYAHAGAGEISPCPDSRRLWVERGVLGVAS